jgi:DNA-binding NarL/FixJ family response regulator
MSNTVLIVDDNQVLRHSIRTWIEASTDWDVCGEAENGAVAVQIVQAKSPDVVILDLAMPVMNGLEAARQISKIAPETAMVMFTMYANEPLKKEARAAGIREVVAKAGEGAPALISTIKHLLPADKM